MSPAGADFEPVRQALAAGVAEGTFPAAQALVARGNEILLQETVGSATPDTFFDLASLTKPLATAALAARFIDQGRISLDTPLGTLLPEVLGTGKEALTMGALLSHATGLPSWVPYYQELSRRYTDTVKLPFAELRAEITGRILAEPLFPPEKGTQRYSDFDFILLGEALARLAGKPLDRCFTADLASPLRVSAHFRKLPSDRADAGRYAPTEDCPWRKTVLRGVVHDDHAYLMGGVAGHAGLFGSARDVFMLSSAWRKAFRGEVSLFTPATVRTLLSRASTAPGDTWTYGWDTPSESGSTSGKLFSRNSVGHLGYTGTSLWIDLDRDITVVLLTNRVNPSRANEGIKAFRPRFHDLVMGALLG